MPSLSFVDQVVGPEDSEQSHITDLIIAEMDGTEFLISTTRYDGSLRSWGIENGSLQIIDDLAYTGGDGPGASGSIGVLSGAFLVGGASGGSLQTVDLQGDGNWAMATPLAPLPTGSGQFGQSTTVLASDGRQFVFGAVPTSDTITRLTFDVSNVLEGRADFTDPQAQHIEDIVATEAVTVADFTYLFTLSAATNGISSWSLDTTGTPTLVTNIGHDESLWISTPTTLEHAVVGGQSYLILGAAGSGSISVLRVGADGSLAITDHLLDDLATRFDGITALEVIEYQGMTYVVAGGADDGITIFRLLDGGLLVPADQIADTTEMGLQNVNAIAGRVDGEGLDLFVASSSEFGVTYLRYDIGLSGQALTATLAGGILAGTAGGDILYGQDGNDAIQGGEGDDILRDAAGEDELTGGPGADVFLMSSDGETDRITDFTVGQDRLDLSLWPLLRDASQLTINIRDYGMDIRYGDELLIVESADGQPIDYRFLGNSDLIGSARIGAIIEPGYPGPERPPPDDNDDEPLADQGAAYQLADQTNTLHQINVMDLGGTFGGASGLTQLRATGTVAGTASDDRLEGTSGNETINAGAGDDLLIGGAGDDFLSGEDGDDILLAGAGNDSLIGGPGSDLLLGRSGDDLLQGGHDADRLVGGEGNDVLQGQNGHDLLFGGLGDDRLNGGPGDDILSGNEGADTFVFVGGRDVITDFEQTIDRIVLDAALWTGLASAEDVLFVYGQIDGTQATVDLDNGNILTIQGVADFSTLAQDIDLF